MALYKNKRLFLTFYTKYKYSKEDYSKSIIWLRKWAKIREIDDVELIVDNRSPAPVVNNHIDAKYNLRNTLLDLTVSAIGRLGEK
ncbi:MAG: hypothetical protein HUU10_14550 [Bacteroidetes bacterium]|nr:hypothetical protein [Bacteroidota bacterium]